MFTIKNKAFLILTILALTFVLPNIVNAELTEGSYDYSFKSGDASVNGTNGRVYTMLEQPDGKVIIAGNFTKVNNFPANRIARLNLDGTLDWTFSTGTGSDAYIFALAQQPDGRLIIGGESPI